MATIQSHSGLGVLGRLTWMIIGPLALIMAGFAIVKAGKGWLTGADLAFLGILGLMLLGRWLEFQGGNPQTADGERATVGHLRRYVLWTCTGGLGAWLAINLVGNYWLNH